MEEAKNGKRRRILIGTVVVVILFLLPAGSLFYLQSGLNYRTKIMAGLGDFGKIGDFNLLNQNGTPVSPETLSGRVSVVNFLPGNTVADRAICERFGKLQQGFDETSGVVFLSFIATDSIPGLLQIAKDLGINDHEQHFLLGASALEWQRLATDAFQMKNPGSQVALVDSNLTIRNYYDLNSNQEMGRLVEHIALIIPKQNRR